MNSKEFKNYARLRNGVETVPSNIRKNYHLERYLVGNSGASSFRFQDSSIEFQKTLQLCEGFRTLRSKSGTCINQGREYQRISEEIRYYTTKYEFFKVL